MKKIILSILAAMALASCAKSGVSYSEDPEIRLEPWTTLSTRAHAGAVDGAVYPAEENFDVYGYWAEDWDGKIVNYILSDVEGSGAEFECHGDYWTGKLGYYWPKNGSLKFACYSPSSENITHVYATDTFVKEGYVQSSETSKTKDLLLAPMTPAYTAESASSNVVVTFEHALSWITIEVKAKSEVAAKAFDINKVTIHDVYTVADLSAAMLDGIQGDEWSNLSAKSDYVVFKGSQYVTMEAQPIETSPRGTIVIPQATTKVTIEYTQRKLDGTAELQNQKIVRDLVLGSNYKNWEPGKHYVYTLTFNLEEIKIKPTVKPWTPVENTLNKND